MQPDLFSNSMAAPGVAAPAYRRIADAIADAVAAGAVSPGDRLPTHRALAVRLGMAVPTISRGYREAEQRGLVTSVVGRGTFVSAVPNLREPAPDGPVDLAVNAPARGDHAALLQSSLAAAAADPGTAGLLSYSPDIGGAADRRAAADWLAVGGLKVDPGRIAICAGGQHAILVALAASLRPGHALLTESLTYPGAKAAAQMLGLRVVGVAMDSGGLSLDALEAACRRADVPPVLYCMPTAHNPTAISWSRERREGVVDIARRHDLTLIEDDVFGMLTPGSERPPALVTLAPERTLHLTSLSKTLTPGLRWGAVVTPEHFVDRIGALIRATVFNASPIGADIARRWLTDGSAAQLLHWQRAEIAGRFATAHRVLTACSAVASVRTGGLHVWLELAEPWTPAELRDTARRLGIEIGATSHFHADAATAADPRARGVRLCLGNAPDRTVLATALTALAAELDRGPTWASGTRV